MIDAAGMKLSPKASSDRLLLAFLPYIVGAIYIDFKVLNFASPVRARSSPYRVTCEYGTEEQ